MFHTGVKYHMWYVMLKSPANHRNAGTHAFDSHAPGCGVSPAAYAYVLINEHRKRFPTITCTGTDGRTDAGAFSPSLRDRSNPGVETFTERIIVHVCVLWRHKSSPKSAEITTINKYRSHKTTTCTYKKVAI